MKLLQWLGLAEKPKKEDKDVDKKFSIEYYPLAGKYFPKYKNYYLSTHYLTGIVETRESHRFMYADNFTKEEDCYKTIELFKEQQLKDNVKTIIYEG